MKNSPKTKTEFPSVEAVTGPLLEGKGAAYDQALPT